MEVIKITGSQFQTLCGKHLIDMNVALENEKVLNALRKDTNNYLSRQELHDNIERILIEEF
tara:strand:- start:869 stop:1051 length:183 start_codon:yes stop_codon:yes gene_type:complete